jgi:hypothetical protein
MLLDALLAVSALLRVVPADASGVSETVAEIAELVEKVYGEVRRRASDLRNELGESGVVGGIVDALLGREGGEGSGVGVAVEEVVGEAGMEMWVASVVESWIEGLDGVLRVKLHR